MGTRGSGNEPDDNHTYNFVYLSGDTFRFYLEAVKYYESLLNADIEAIESDPDLERILPSRLRDTFEIGNEVKRISWTCEWMGKVVAEFGEEAYDYDQSISHGQVRLLKSVSGLYLQHLRNRRDVMAPRHTVSRHALQAVDQRLSKLTETTALGIFSDATPMPLLIDAVPEETTSVEHQAQDAVAGGDVTRIRPVVTDTIEIRDPMLRKRCLDLFEAFRQDGEHERLDTVLTEATRILEDRLRSVSGAQADCIGLNLSAYAFSGERPRLLINDSDAEQQAAHSLFRGVIGLIRNNVHHRLVNDLDPDRVL